MLKRRWPLICLLMLLLASSGCAPAVSEEEASLLGETDGDKYVNRALNFTAFLPDGWQFASDEVLEEATGLVRDTIKKETDIEPGSTVTLMLCSQNEFVIPSTENNPNINIGFTNSPSTLKMLTDADLYNEFIDQYVTVFDELYKGADNLLTGERNVQINGKTYTAVYLEASFNDGVMYQNQYYTDIGDGVLITTLTYFDRASKDAMDTFMQNLKFEL